MGSRCTLRRFEGIVIKRESQVVDLGALLDSGPWTSYQKGIVALTASAVAFDGLDIQIIGFAIPAIAKDWGLAKPLFASVLAAGLFGVALGSALGGLIGDRVGRRPALIMSVFVFAASTCAIAFTNTLIALLFLRFFAGVGIGSALPNAATLTAEYTPLNRRPFATTLTIICIPVGGVIAGLIASSLLGAHSWRLLFIVAGLLPILCGFFLLIFLPESPRFLAKNSANGDQLRKILRAISRPVDDLTNLSLREETHAVEATPGLRGLFANGHARDTVALWSAFFFCLLTVYLAFNWLPSILTACDLTSKEAGQGLTVYNCGGIIGAVAVGWWISLTGSRTPMSLSAILAILSAGLLALLVRTHTVPLAAILTTVGFHGFAVNAVQTTLYALATHIYTTSIRATGVAFALAIGRTGAIASAYLGAKLLALPVSGYFFALAGTMCCVLIAIQVICDHIRRPAMK
jgi:MFS transporter, AAHS family, 4-hydroxybenzoate transporter